MWKELEILRKKYLAIGLSDQINFEKHSIISIVYNSARIEGCLLNENETRLLIENNIKAKEKPLIDNLMIQDHYEAFKFLKEVAKEKRKLSIDFIKMVAGYVMKNTGSCVNTISGTFDTSKGDIRKTQVYVEQKYFPDFNKVEDLLKNLIKDINQRIDKVSGNDILKLSADIHYYLVNIHPFGDGNGRTSRLMMNYIQMYHNEPLINISAEDRKEYFDALNKTDEKEDISLFRNFICYQQTKHYISILEGFTQQ